MFDKEFKPDPKPEPRKKKAKKRINPISDKERSRKKQYKPIRDRFLLDHPICQACNFKHSDQVHHKKGRTGRLLIAVEYFLACCDTCHRFIEDNPATALKMGWSLKRIGK